ncbi:YbhB/YbcL family Raf kinase inhibitor-like protein [Natronomonas gomsonensis]|uniref:YbhB/YbcL family Raf kinase inhibitor-like protein n=1 Tax=Natronomonas gomsonensis TaxID=1046043 RepID=UPI0020CA6035|nr:YbhB/YbcL family Raf kinase inhibitor-like protein [Natronomonas gomsonensis]MCY4730548.1 YbhB/YbcL family Raf kinase inhibitor-like protein [Natronomonas gomsonensis]
MTEKWDRRRVLGATAATASVALAGCSGSSNEDTPENNNDNDGDDTDQEDSTDTEENDDDSSTDSMPSTILNGDVEQQGELQLSSPDFEDGEQMPDWTGKANEDENPELEISGVPDGAESLVLVVDDPDAQPVAGHTWDHWYAWDIDPEIGTIPRNWSGDATEGHNDFLEYGYGGPSPPEGSHGYRFKLVAIDSELGVPAETRKTRVGSAIAMNAEVLASTQIVGTYHADQGTTF